MYLSLRLRLTGFSLLLLILALCGFGLLVTHLATERAYAELDSTLSNRAASVQIGKYLLQPASLPTFLPGVAGTGSAGVSIEVLDTRFHLLATTDGLNGSPFQPYLEAQELSPVPWDSHAARILLHRLPLAPYTPQSMYSSISYHGQQVRIYTLLNTSAGLTHLIQTARSEQSVQDALKQLNAILLGGSLLVVLLAALGSWLITSRLLARVQQLTQVAQTITQKHSFDRRVEHAVRGGRDELSELVETFNTMLDQLERLYRQQQRFVADASHELRAPITSIRCNLDLLTETEQLAPEDKQAALNDARAEAERMGQLVHDLLTLARADASLQQHEHASLQANHAVIDLDSLLLEVFRRYHALQENSAAPAKRRARLLLQHILPAQIRGDANQVKQVLISLVDNALKYTPADGTVILHLDTDEQWATITISDTGKGISAEDLPHIFERFYRARHTSEQSGSGLGLAIAQSIVQEHRGTIGVESTPGQGSIFSIRFPVTASGKAF